MILGVPLRVAARAEAGVYFAAHRLATSFRRALNPLIRRAKELKIVVTTGWT